MGRHRPVSQTVIISFIPSIPGKLEGSAESCPRPFAWSVAESKNQLSAVSSQSIAVTAALPYLVKETPANDIRAFGRLQGFDNKDLLTLS